VRGRRPAGDDGSALVLALFFVTVFALFVSAVVQFAQVSYTATQGFAGQRGAAYDVDAAVETAIHRFALGDPCGTFDAPALNQQGQRVAVNCTPEEPRTGGTTSSPGHAVLALGQDSAEGVRTSSPDLLLRGDVYSHSSVDVRNGARLTVQGTVSARGDCEQTENIVTARDATPRCANTSGGDPDRAADPLQGADPDYPAATRTVPRRQVVDPGACAAAGWLVPVLPGYYDDAAALSGLTTGGACAGKVVWFQPGTYYLDFRRSTEWLVDDPEVTVVAGTPRGWRPADAVSTARPQLPVPGSCAGESDPGPNDGVQMVFGGESRLRVARGEVDVCATPSRSEQQIAVYGIGPERDLRTLKPTDTADVTDAQAFENPYRALTLERPARTAEAVLPGPQGQITAAVTLLGYRPRVPPGSVVDSAVLRVAHRESGDVTEVRAVLTNRGGQEITVSSEEQGCALCRRATLTEDVIDVHARGLSTAEAFDGLAVTFEARLSAGGRESTVALDAVWLDVAFRAPDTRKPFAATAVDGFDDVEQAFDIGGSPTPPAAVAELSSGRRGRGSPGPSSPPRRTAGCAGSPAGWPRTPSSCPGCGTPRSWTDSPSPTRPSWLREVRRAAPDWTGSGSTSSTARCSAPPSWHPDPASPTRGGRPTSTGRPLTPGWPGPAPQLPCCACRATPRQARTRRSWTPSSCESGTARTPASARSG